MNAVRRVGAWLPLPALLSTFLFVAGDARAQNKSDEIRIAVAENIVELSTDRGGRWVPVQKGAVLRAGDRLRTGSNSRAALRVAAATLINYSELTEIEILPPDSPGWEPGIHILRGILWFFHKDKPGRIRVISPGAVAGVHGTEFVMSFDPDSKRTTVAVFDGTVSFGNTEATPITLTNRQGAFVDPGREPERAPPGFVANNLVQWAAYYPAVPDPIDLELSPDEQQTLRKSLAAYHQGDLLAALDAYGTREPASNAERIYSAALLLAVGQASKSSDTLLQVEQANPSERIRRLAAALRQQIAAAMHEELAATKEPELTTELMAASYYEQSRAKGDETLQRALNFAKRAATNSPEFGFAQVRVAELEFSFGRTAKAKEALSKSLVLSPRNAQAIALNGFLLAAQNKPREAIEWFDRAIAADSALANAWLGRGLCRIRRGDRAGGREDLLVAAGLEPLRAQLRSYLGKAFGDAGDASRALHELKLAEDIDPRDPTAWFYSALVKAQQNRINAAIADLERSQELNDNRQVYRSRFLLDQDRAMRMVNLARLYADSDLTDVAVREASRAVALDYANYSAHSFLANSYEVERRANLSNLRFEAVSFNEYLLANLLGPANGLLLAQSVNQLEYSGLFERNRLGLFANTEYFSRGAWHHSSAQYGTYNDSSYSLEAEYRSEDGERVNQDYELRQLEAKFKHDITPNDSVYFHIMDSRRNGGDIAQYYDEGDIRSGFRFEDKQTPNILGGYHRQWSPQSHTLLLVARLDDKFESSDPSSAAYVLARTNGVLENLLIVPVRDTFRSQRELYSVELQQILTLGRHSIVAGTRAQWSKEEAWDRTEVSSTPSTYRFLLGTNPVVSLQKKDVRSFMTSVYTYDTVRLADTLFLVGGLNFTYQSVPVNVVNPPLSSDREHQERLSPKVAMVWSPGEFSSLRAGYTKSLSGSGLGQSVRLEPTQVAGLLQTFRDVAPLSLVGDLDGADIETSELLWEGRFHRTYVSLSGQHLTAERNRRLGLFLADQPEVDGPAPGLIRESVRFRENGFESSVHQLVGDEWSFGVRYRLSYAHLKKHLLEYPGLGAESIPTRSEWRGWLNTLSLSGLYRHPSGFFARAEGVLFAQDLERDGSDAPSDNFWQVNLITGYRFPRQKAEIAVGVLNLVGDDYQLDPINRHAEQPRSRTFYARLLINF